MLPVVPQIIVSAPSGGGVHGWPRLLREIAEHTPGVSVACKFPAAYRDILKADGQRWPCPAPVYPED